MKLSPSHILPAMMKLKKFMKLNLRYQSHTCMFDCKYRGKGDTSVREVRLIINTAKYTFESFPSYSKARACFEGTRTPSTFTKNVEEVSDLNA